MTIKHIFVIGAGSMGNGIAQVAAPSGYQVTCMDVMPAALLRKMVDAGYLGRKAGESFMDTGRAGLLRSGGGNPP